MKKFAALCFSLFFAFTMSACANNESGDTSSSQSSVSSGEGSTSSSSTVSAEVGNDSLEISEDGHINACFEVWSEDTDGKADYVKYSFWFTPEGSAVVNTSYFKALDKSTANDADKQTVNDSIKNNETVWFSNSDGGSTFSWNELGVGNGAQFGGKAPESFDQLFTVLSDYWRVYVSGNVCVVPTAVFGENLETFHSFSYSVDAETRVVTINGEASFDSLILNTVANVGVCTIDGKVLNTQSVDYRFSEYIENI